MAIDLRGLVIPFSGLSPFLHSYCVALKLLFAYGCCPLSSSLSSIDDTFILGLSGRRNDPF